MLTQEKSLTQTLYDTDYNLWVLETVQNLKSRDFKSLDWENLIEEVLDLSRRDKKKLKSLLRNLFEHLLKLKYWESAIENNQAHWKGEIRNFRKQIKDELKDSPSLKNYLNDVLLECYQDSREIVSDKSQLPLSTFPEQPIANLDQVLDENWVS
jgi:hypothetical protein